MDACTWPVNKPSLANVSNKILMEITDWKHEWNHLKWFASLSTLVPRVHGLTFSNITSMDRLSINKLHLSLHLTRVVNACFLFWKKTCRVYFLCMSFSLHKLFILSLQTKNTFWNLQRKYRNSGYIAKFQPGSTWKQFP